MVGIYDTRREAIAFAKKRKAGFRQLAKEDSSRKNFFYKIAIPSVKIRKIQYKHWKEPLYEVEGM